MLHHPCGVTFAFNRHSPPCITLWVSAIEPNSTPANGFGRPTHKQRGLPVSASTYHPLVADLGRPVLSVLLRDRPVTPTAQRWSPFDTGDNHIYSTLSGNITHISSGIYINRHQANALEYLRTTSVSNQLHGGEAKHKRDGSFRIEEGLTPVGRNSQSTLS